MRTTKYLFPLMISACLFGQTHAGVQSIVDWLSKQAEADQAFHGKILSWLYKPAVEGDPQAHKGNEAFHEDAKPFFEKIFDWMDGATEETRGAEKDLIRLKAQMEQPGRLNAVGKAPHDANEQLEWIARQYIIRYIDLAKSYKNPSTRERMKKGVEETKAAFLAQFNKAFDEGPSSSDSWV